MITSEVDKYAIQAHELFVKLKYRMHGLGDLQHAVPSLQWLVGDGKLLCTWHPSWSVPCGFRAVISVSAGPQSLALLGLVPTGALP